MKWTVGESRTLYDCPWFRLDLTDVTLPNGTRIAHHVIRVPAPSVCGGPPDGATPGRRDRHGQLERRPGAAYQHHLALDYAAGRCARTLTTSAVLTALDGALDAALPGPAKR